MDDVLLQSTREFWNANPCGVEGDFAAVRAQRYAMEPWIPSLLREITCTHRSIVEVGCGQGVDSIEICQTLPKDGEYVGVDYSERSVKIATENALYLAPTLKVQPEYKVANAEALDFSDRRFDAAYSMGVLHHTADEHGAIREIHRILRPGGTAYICLYRKPSPKVAIARGLRLVQKGIDALLGTDRCVYNVLRKGGVSRRFGTMFLECFGVPYMKWYTRQGVCALFGDFATVEVSAAGPNLGRLTRRARSPRLGYFLAYQGDEKLGEFRIATRSGSASGQ